MVSARGEFGAVCKVAEVLPSLINPAALCQKKKAGRVGFETGGVSTGLSSVLLC